jgi:2-octaprenyl-6-methoxyphenol hydroxylase
MKAMKEPYDVLIVGGGLVGASLATALGGQPLRVALMEAMSFGGEGQRRLDERAIALACGSQRILKTLGVWQRMAAGAEPIHRVHVSDRGHFGAVRIHCREEGVDALGYVASSGVLGDALAASLADVGNLEVICPARLIDVGVSASGVEAQIEHASGQGLIRTRLLVAADGGESAVRRRLGIGAIRWDYGQSAVIATVRPERPHRQTAYERFTETGPLALLPVTDERCAVIWTVRPEQACGLAALSDAAFASALYKQFGSRLGRFSDPSARSAYSLRLVRSREQVRRRVAVIGNAAHALHPIAGQGFNLGLRDVAALAEVLADGARVGRDPGDLELLRDYARRREHDQRVVVYLTDGLARLFSSPLPPVTVLRDLGLVALERLPQLKHLLARQTMGLAGRLPRLVRGLSLSPPSSGAHHG